MIAHLVASGAVAGNAIWNQIIESDVEPGGGESIHHPSSLVDDVENSSDYQGHPDCRRNDGAFAGCRQKFLHRSHVFVSGQQGTGGFTDKLRN